MKRKLILLLFSSLLLHPSAFPQGSLTPPGAPAPTMKTLDQVEARTPLAGGTSPLSVGASGSYYLTGNLTISTTANGLTVSASDVTIDLNGFTLTGPSSGTGAGIYLTGGISNVTIVNGTIRNWGIHGINSLGNPNLRAEKLRVISNGGNGIAADVNAEVVNCFAQSNVDTGIYGKDNCLIKDCQVTGTTGSPGDGISVGAASIVTGCVARTNMNGIVVAQGSTVSGCNAFGNAPDGIKATSDCLILSNNSSNNNGAGIRVSGGSNRIESNHAMDNISSGIRVDGTSNLIIRNTASAGGSAYFIAANNKVGVIVFPPNSPAIPGGTAAGVGTTDPWANFSY